MKRSIPAADTTPQRHRQKPLLPLSPQCPTGSPTRYELLDGGSIGPPQRPVLERVEALTEQRREEELQRWKERVQITEALKRTPRPPILVNRAVFLGDLYGQFVRTKRMAQAQQDLKKVAQEASRSTTDEMNCGTGFGEGGELRGEDLRLFQRQWLVLVNLVAFLRLKKLARQHIALRRLKHLLAPRIMEFLAKKRRVQREQTVLGLFGATMAPVTVATMRGLSVFSDVDEGTLLSLEGQWTACCFIDQFIIDERCEASDVYLLDQGVVEITKRQVPTVEVLAQMMASKSYIAAHGAAWAGVGTRHQSIAWEQATTPVPPTPPAEATRSIATNVATVAFGQKRASQDIAPPPRRRGGGKRTLGEALRDNYEVIGTIDKRGTLLGLLSLLEGNSSFVGYRASAAKRCMAWRLPRRVFNDVLRKRPTSAYTELLRELRVAQLAIALPATPQALRNCDINIVFRHWDDSALEELIKVLRPVSYMPNQTILDTTATPRSSASVVFVARGVASVATTTSHSVAALYQPRERKSGQAEHMHTDLALMSSTVVSAVAAPTRAPAKPSKVQRGGVTAVFAAVALASPSGPSLNNGGWAVAPPLEASTVAPAHDHVSSSGGGVTVGDASSPTKTHTLADLYPITHRGTVGPWQCIGDIGALVNERRSICMTASSCVDAWMCSKEAFSSIIQGHPALLLGALQAIKDVRANDVGRRGHGLLRAILGKEPLLKNAPERLYDELVQHAKPFWCPPHEFLCGKDPLMLPTMMVLLDGTAFVQRPAGTSAFHAAPHGGGGDNAPDVLAASLGPGTVLNTGAMLMEQTWVHSYTIRTRTAVEGFEIASDAFCRALERSFGSRKEEAKAKAYLSKLRETVGGIVAKSNYVPFVQVKLSDAVVASAAAAVAALSAAQS